MRMDTNRRESTRFGLVRGRIRPTSRPRERRFLPGRGARLPLSMLCNGLWESPLFFASIGPLWILAALLANGLFLAKARRDVATLA